MDQKPSLHNTFANLKAAWNRVDGESPPHSVINVVAANIDSGRAARVLSNYDVENLTQYVANVQEYYEEWHEVVTELKRDADSPLWADLYDTLIRWAYALIRRHAAFLPHDEIEETALACAADTAIVILRQRFPYDTDFHAWSYVVMRQTTFNHVRRLTNGPSIPDQDMIHLEQYEGWLENIADPAAEKPLELLEISQMLLEAIDQLTELQREFAILFYVEQRPYAEIAEILEKEINNLYKLRFAVIKAIGKILTEEGYKYG